MSCCRLRVRGLLHGCEGWWQKLSEVDVYTNLGRNGGHPWCTYCLSTVLLMEWRACQSCTKPGPKTSLSSFHMNSNVTLHRLLQISVPFMMFAACLTIAFFVALHRQLCFSFSTIATAPAVLSCFAVPLV